MATPGQAMRNEVKEKLKKFKARVVGLQKQARDFQEHAERLGPTDQRRRYAVVERSRCTGCGLCEQLCPVGAIRVTYVANIDAQRCTGCGTCVQECPQDAVHLATATRTLARESESA